MRSAIARHLSAARKIFARGPDGSRSLRASLRLPTAQRMGNAGAGVLRRRSTRSLLRETTALTQPMSRAEILSRGARAGVAVAVGGSALAAFSADASAATLPDGDLAYVRLLVASELLAIDYYTRAIASNQIDGKALANMKHALANEKQHYASLSTVLAESGQVAATADDINFAYPRRAFASAASIGKVGDRHRAHGARRVPRCRRGPPDEHAEAGVRPDRR